MKKRGLLMLFACVLALVTVTSFAYADEEPVACTIELSPEFLVGPGDVTVTITISNTTDKDLQDPVVLFSPQAEVISDFGDNGSVTLKAGESKTWTGTYSVNERELDQGYIQYFAKYTTYQESGQATPRSQSIRATVSRTEAEVAIDVDRTITPPSAHEGQEVQVKYTITNAGTVPLTDVTITEHKDINSKSQTIPQLDPGAKVDITYKATMGKKDLTSSAEITYKAQGSTKKETHSVEEKTIPYAEADLTATLSSNVKGVVSGGTINLKLELKNKGSVDLSDLRVTDPLLGDVFTNQKIEAGKTLTLEKELTLTETNQYQFTITAIDSTGTEITAASNALSVTAMDPDEALNLTLTATPDRTEVYDEPAGVRFTLTVTNNSRVDATDVKISHGTVELYTFKSIPAGESRTMSRDTVLSTSGKFQFTAVAKDPLENENTFLSNEMQIAVYQPTPVPATPTPAPEPTPEPVFVPVTVVPIHHDSIGTLPKAIQKVLLPVLIVAGVLLLAGAALLLVAAKKRHDAKKASAAAYDHLERARRRDYVTANPDELAATSKETLARNSQLQEEPEPEVVLNTGDDWDLPPFEAEPLQQTDVQDTEGYSSFGQGFYGEVDASGFEPAEAPADQNAFYAYNDLDADAAAYQPQPGNEQQDVTEQPSYGYEQPDAQLQGEYPQWEPQGFEDPQGYQDMQGFEEPQGFEYPQDNGEYMPTYDDFGSEGSAPAQQQEAAQPKTKGKGLFRRDR